MDFKQGIISFTRNKIVLKILKYKKGKNIMCEANAYLIQKDEKKLVMEAVDTVEPEGDGIRLVSIFGDQKFLKAHIHSLALVDHNIFLKE